MLISEHQTHPEFPSIICLGNTIGWSGHVFSSSWRAEFVVKVVENSLAVFAVDNMRDFLYMFYNISLYLYYIYLYIYIYVYIYICISFLYIYIYIYIHDILIYLSILSYNAIHYTIQYQKHSQHRTVTFFSPQFFSQGWPDTAGRGARMFQVEPSPSGPVANGWPINLELRVHQHRPCQIGVGRLVSTNCFHFFSELSSGSTLI